MSVIGFFSDSHTLARLRSLTSTCAIGREKVWTICRNRGDAPKLRQAAELHSLVQRCAVRAFHRPIRALTRVNDAEGSAARGSDAMHPRPHRLRDKKSTVSQRDFPPNRDAENAVDDLNQVESKASPTNCPALFGTAKPPPLLPGQNTRQTDFQSPF